MKIVIVIFEPYTFGLHLYVINILRIFKFIILCLEQIIFFTIFISLFFFCLVGTTVAGHVDNIARLQELCRQHDAWLHLRGHCLAALALAGQPTLAGVAQNSGDFVASFIS